MKAFRSLALFAMLILFTMSVLPLGAGAQGAAQQTYMPPSAIQLTMVPPDISPGGSGAMIVQLVDSAGTPAPAGGPITVSLFSSEPGVASVPSQAVVPYGESHVEVNVTAGISGAAQITAISGGFSTGSAAVSVAQFNGFSIQVTPLQPVASPGDAVTVQVELVAGTAPFVAPIPVSVEMTNSLPGSSAQTITIPQGDAYAYTSITIPATTDLGSMKTVTVTAAANGFISGLSAISISKTGVVPAQAVVTSDTLTIGTGGELAVLLYDNTSLPVSGSFTASMFSSNSSIISLQSSQITISGDSAVFQVNAMAVGTAEVTVLVPGVASIPALINVVSPYKAHLAIAAPKTIRTGEEYSFSVGFYSGNEPVPLPATVYLSSSNPDISVPSQIKLSDFGFGVAKISASYAGNSNITAVLQGVEPAAFRTSSVSVPLVVPVTYTVTLKAGSLPLQSVGVNFTSGAKSFPVQTDSSGDASFTALNDTSMKVSVPTTIQASSNTQYRLQTLGGGGSNAANFTSGAPLVAQYATYYQFTVISQIGTAAGSGWYKANSTAVYSVDITSSGGPLVYQRFVGWSGSFTSQQQTGAATITDPESISAQWAADNTLLYGAIGGVIGVAALIGVVLFKLKKRGEK